MRIFGVKLRNCGLQVSFQKECNSFLMFPKKKKRKKQGKLWSKQTSAKSKLELRKEVAEQQLTKKYTSLLTNF